MINKIETGRMIRIGPITERLKIEIKKVFFFGRPSNYIAVVGFLSTRSLSTVKARQEHQDLKLSDLDRSSYFLLKMARG